MKNFYLPKIRVIMDMGTILGATLQRNTTSVVGKNFTMPIIRGFNEGQGFLGEESALHAARNVLSSEAIVPSKYFETSIQVTRVSMKASDRKQYAKSLDTEIKYALIGGKKEMNRVFYGNGTGVLAYMTTTDDSWAGGCTVDDGSGNDFHYCRSDMLVDVLNVNDSYKLIGEDIRLTARTVNTITAATSPTGSDDGDLIVRANSNDATAGAAPSNWWEIMGLDGIVSASDPVVGSLQGQTRVANEWWQATVTGIDDDISDVHVQGLKDDVESHDGTVNLWLMSRGVRTQMFANLVLDRRFNNTTKLNGGFSAVLYDDVPMVVDNDCQKQTLYAIDTSVLSIYVLDPWNWMDEDGNVLDRTGTTMAFNATLCYYAELGVDNPTKLAKGTGINE